MKRRIGLILVCIMLSATLLLQTAVINVNETYLEKHITVNEEANQPVFDDSIDWWSMQGHDLQRTGSSTSTGPETNEIFWKKACHNTIDNQPIIADNKIFVHMAGPTDYSLRCLDVKDGNTLWEFPTHGAPPTVYDGKVYFSGGSSLFVLDAETGDQIEQLPFDGIYYVTVAEGKLYFSCGKVLYCYDIDNLDDELWNFTTVKNINTYPAFLEDKIYIGTISTERKVYCLDATNGDHIWNTTVNTDAKEIVVYDEKIYVKTTNRIYCKNPENGSNYWQKSGFSQSHFSAAYGNLYVSFPYLGISCIDASTGEYIWNYTAGLDMFFQTAPSVADGKVYVVINDFMPNEGIVTCLDAYGNGDNTTNELWNYTTITPPPYPPTIACGKVFVGERVDIDEPAWLYCFGTNDDPDTPDQPEGPSKGGIGIDYTFSVDPAEDPDGDEVFYQFRWDDGSSSSWTNTLTATKNWTEAGDYGITVKAKDGFGGTSDWSESLTISILDLNITEIKGGGILGFLGINVVIENNGENNADDLNWNISIEGGTIIIPSGGTKEGTINIRHGDDDTVSMFVFGFGRVNITATTECGDPKSVDGFIVGPFVFIT